MTQIKKIGPLLKIILKGNVMFGLGMVVGSIIGTLTTILFTMGYMGLSETIILYQNAICGGF